VRGAIPQDKVDCIRVLAKIQTNEALHNFDEILAESDGIIICRAELSMELPPEKFLIAQKWMIEKANLAAKPVLIQN
jgi:pyruvate kinase